jgi:hypothetical protein
LVGPVTRGIFEAASSSLRLIFGGVLILAGLPFLLLFLAAAKLIEHLTGKAI